MAGRPPVRSRAAVLGHPIGHSLSPVLHRAAYESLGLDDWSYEAVDVTEDTLESFLAGLDDSWKGLSLTMPLKQTVMGMLDHVDPLAVVTGAVNTVVFQGAGAARTLVGANTDVYGLVVALREGGALRGPRGGDDGHPVAGSGPVASTSAAASTGSTQDPGPRSAVILGAGATAASTLAALAELGIPTADVYVRSLGRTGDLQRAAHRMGLVPRFHPIAEAAAAAVRADVVVSTLPAHGADAVAEEILALGKPVHGILLDVAYDPRVTALSAAWRDAGGTAVPGQRMLLHQAAEQVRLMTGHVAPVQAMDDALEAALAH
ncbi:shikimate dehydrogenase [Sanguibacter sp. Leaf3]|uniref:shikimate dehydrogenase n=1 Tax=Sanguibacter sp. Leaf3 TaxID=1736209 RepID=UPI0006F2D8ED|nr:shikimate dehydrogenase [Sanguibacter sp. Leaf3]KQT98171.1 shikimate dehydrogenase [Sanguibacter sp. Leaf3]